MTDIGEYGLWLATTDGRDFVFFDEQTAAVHQWQIIAHELAHMLLGHTTAVVGSETPISVAGFVLRRSQHAGRQERDAELLATLLQAEIIKRAGLQALTSQISSQPAWAGFIKGTGVE
jgi:Zn-dependent peptidase ImmA (M78 family)